MGPNVCQGLKGGTQTLETTVVPWAEFIAYISRQVSMPITFSSYVGKAVSVQNSCGAILSCGWLESHFPVYASYNGQIALWQYSRYHPTYILNLDIIHYNVLEGIAGTCSSKAGIFNLWNPTSPLEMGTGMTADQFPVGELSKRPCWEGSSGEHIRSALN